MGWWEEVRNGTKVDIGDDPLDIAQVALQKIIRVYRRDLKRKPTPEEIAEILEWSIRVVEEDLFADMDARELKCVEVELRTRTERQRPKVGDYFAVPLVTGGYGFGRIKGMYNRYSVLVEFLAERSDALLDITRLRSTRALFECLTATYGIARDEWLLLGNGPVPPDKSGLTLKELQSYHRTRLGGSYGHEAARIVLEWYLGGQKGPKPYESRD